MQKQLQFDDNTIFAPKAEKVAAIMVLFRPPNEVVHAIENTLRQVGWLIIVDNGENGELQEKLSVDMPQIIWLRNKENGLARAQNKGTEHAKKLGATWLLLLDDDSLMAQDMVQNLCSAYDELDESTRTKIAILAPYLKEEALGKAPHYIQPAYGGWFKRRGFEGKAHLYPLFYACASGSLIPMRVIESIGGMEEAFFLYFIDTEFCLRARAHGLVICAVKSAVLHHQIGERTSHYVGGRVVSTTNHSAYARYWMARNRTKLWWRYVLKQPGYVMFDMIRFVSEVARIVMFETDVFAKLRAMRRGMLQQKL